MLSQSASQHVVVGDSVAPPGLLHEFFERQAYLRPNSIAVTCANRNVKYGQLEAESNRLARYLLAQGVSRGCTVGLLLPRSEDVYLAMLGVLKAGAAYVPIDPDYPSERVRFILNDSGAGLLLTCGSLATKAEGLTKSLMLERVKPELGALSALPAAPLKLKPDDLCYVIYTSGTTGHPKGVQIEHRSIAHFVEVERRLFDLCPQDRVFQGFSIAFDASLEEIWLAFAAGATLVTGTSDMVRSGPALSRLLSELGVTVLSCVPTLLSMMEEDVPTLRLLILGGEVCPPELVKRWFKPARRIVNTYGPTEATVVATYSECSATSPVTIGRPLPGYTTYVLDEELKKVKPGAEGELAIGGIGLARGYLGRPELTAEKFVSCFLEGKGTERLYRTGDRVRCLDSGDLQFLGRLDGQVKIRGFRVELAEIESVLLQNSELKSAAVSQTQGPGGISRLAAYIVPCAGSNPDLHDIRQYLKQRLPPYMVPSTIDLLPALPTLASGKVDRDALPAPIQFIALQEESSPGTQVESEIVRTFGRVLGLESISINDDFFSDLGGHSLLAARAVSELRRVDDFRDLSMADLYAYPTAAALGQELQARHLRAGSRRLETIPGAKKQADQAISGAAANERAAESSKPILVWRHFFCGLAQLGSLVFVLSFFALQWLAPYLTYTILVEEEYDVLPAILLAFASLVVLYPVMLLASCCLKWLIIGRYKPGCYPLWGWYYFRFWIVTSIEATVPVSYLSGTPLFPLYLRLMGAKIGKEVFIQTDNFAIYDLLTIGDRSSINAEASLFGYRVEQGHLHIGRIEIGKDCLVGARAALAHDSSMSDDSILEDLSLLQSGQRIGPGERWLGSPAKPHHTIEVKTSNPNAEHAACELSQARGWIYGVLHGLGLLLFPVLVVAALFPGIALMNRLNYLDPYYWYLLLSPLVGASFVGMLCLEIVVLKWLLLGTVRTGRYPLKSWYYLRKWFVDKALELSLDVVGPLYASVYLTPWYKMLGAKLGKGAEISTASFISPDLLTIGEEGFVADNVSLGAPRVAKGFIEVGVNHIGRRSFIGNSAVLPPGAIIGDEVLIGCLSVPPADRADAARRDTAWLGSPALFLKQRLKSAAFPEERTFNPPAHLRVLRATIEFVRVISPSTGFIILTSLLFSALLLLHDRFSLAQTLMFFPVLYLGCGVAAASITIIAKWCLVGKYRPGEKPLWSTFVWRNELINALHEHLAGPFLVGALSGTPFLCWYFRLLGATIGRRVYLETTDFSEFDLAFLGEEAALNADCTIQTHLFEDRIMKMDRVRIGAGCSVGAGSLVLYDTCLEPGSKLGPLSLVMKGEVLPAETAWVGIPARAHSNGCEEIQPQSHTPVTEPA